MDISERLENLASASEQQGKLEDFIGDCEVACESFLESSLNFQGYQHASIAIYNAAKFAEGFTFLSGKREDNVGTLRRLQRLSRLYQRASEITAEVSRLAEDDSEARDFNNFLSISFA